MTFMKYYENSVLFHAWEIVEENTDEFWKKTCGKNNWLQSTILNSVQ